MNRITVGYLTFDLAGTYNHQMWHYLSLEAERRGVRLVTFCGGILYGKSNHQHEWNKIYDLASKESLDGLIVLSASLGQACSTGEMESFLNRFKPLPMVSIGAALRGIPSVVVNNEAGMARIVEHMIDAHGISSPLFLMGPRDNVEAKIRYSVFADVLSKNGIVYDKKNICYGEFRYDRAISVVNAAIENGIKFDSIIASNDDMAMGAVDALIKRGYDVTSDVAVSGFDDSSAALFCTVPLTTVRQPHQAMLESGLDMVLKLIESKPADDLVMLESEIVIRKSCGCTGVSDTGFTDFEDKNLITVLEKSFDNIFKEQVFLDILAEKGIDPVFENTENLYQSFRQYINTKDCNTFIAALLKVVNDNIDKIPYEEWDEILSLWSAIEIKRNFVNQNTVLYVQDCFARARMQIQDMAHNRLLLRKSENQQKDFLMIIFNSYFSPIMEIDNFLKYIQAELPKFGVKEFYVNLFESENNDKCRMIMNFKTDGTAFHDDNGPVFEPVKILPDGLEGTVGNNIVIEPLINYEVLIGFIIFVTDGPMDLIENIRQIVCNSLVSIMLVQEVMRDKQLKILMNNLEIKQKELEEAYASLKDNQNKMLIIEKMASLGRMTAGIAHEMNSPLAAVRASLAELSDLVKEYDESIGDDSVNSDDHKEIASDMKNSLQLAIKSAERAASFVHGIKSQTRDLSLKERISFDAVPVINEAVLLISHAVKKAHCTVNFEYDDRVLVYGVPGRLSQVITNMINNSIEACVDQDEPSIEIKLKKVKAEEKILQNYTTKLSTSVDQYKNGAILLTISDNGSGISAENIIRVFDPIFTTKPFGVGTGLGLTLVHDIVTTDFNGSITVESQPGAGATFFIIFPDPEVEHGSKTD